MDGITRYNDFIAVHKPQLILSGVPEHFWLTICKKLCDQIFDAGLSFQLVQIDYEDIEKLAYDPSWIVLAIRDIDRSDPSHIYLIDHAWTFKGTSVKNNLRNVPGLLERMCNLMQVKGDTEEEKIDEVSRNVWKYAQTYALGGSDLPVEDRVPLWYILDELGSAITHSDSPNFRAVPFIYVPEQMTYTLLFPIKDVEEGEPITKNFVEGDYHDRLQREAMLIPWKHYEHFHIDYTQVEPSRKYFIEGHILESVPNLETLDNKQYRTENLKVYSEYSYINEYLTAPEFEIVTNDNDADILWYIDHFKTYKELSEQTPHKYVNQFPFEYVLTIKDLLAIIARRCSEKTFNDDFETYPLWLPTTFNMKTELPKLVAYYMARKKMGLDNHWICKPYNLARGLDTYITDDLNMLCRLPQSGPKIAQKYVENPVLFERPDVGRVKFDIRYILILKSVKPTEVYVYKNFFLRFANKPFALNNFDDYEQHFTVMNYSENVILFEMLCNKFKEAWAAQYPNNNWSEIEKSIFKMISELFTAATAKDPPCGLGRSPQSRAVYGADIILSWHNVNNELIIQPKLLELNWMPDCRRACTYYPNFYNDIFSVIFLDREVDTCTKVM